MALSGTLIVIAPKKAAAIAGGGTRETREKILKNLSFSISGTRFQSHSRVIWAELIGS